MKNKKVHFLTLGCKVNQYETQALREKFQKYGYTEVSLEKAYTVIINTCTVTQKSDSKSCKIIRKAIRSTSSWATIVVTGCLAELDKERIKEIKGVDFILENKYKPQLLQIVNNKLKTKEKYKEKITYFKGHTRAFIKVQDGCSHNCAYCKVKLARGEPKSRKVKEVVKEVKELLDNGYKEIVLTGICLGAYGKDFSSGAGLIDLLKQLSSLKGDFRIRLSSIEPNYVTKKLIDYILREERICSHLHMPLQSGDDKILKLMKRPYSREDVLGKLHYARGKDNYFSFSTDIMVGFPQEDESSIKNTVEILQEMVPVRTHIFNYSSREGTAAAKLNNESNTEVQRKWYKKILATSDKMSFKYRNMFLDKHVNVLTENIKNSKARGYNERYINIKFPASIGKRGTFSKLRVSRVTQKQTLGSR